MSSWPNPPKSDSGVAHRLRSLHSGLDGLRPSNKSPTMRKTLTIGLSFGLCAFLSASVSGCDSITGCDEDVQRFEATYDGGFYEFYETTILKRWRDRGYDCDAEGIYGSSNRIGTKWTCTGCP